MNLDRYTVLQTILAEALVQASSGKGHERHVTADEPFEEQLGCYLQRREYDFARGQAVKKIDESLRLDSDAAVRELLGAINYLAMAVIVLRERSQHGERKT